MAGKKDFYRHNGENAAKILIAQGKMEPVGYPCVYKNFDVAFNGSWQAKAWKEGFDKIRSEWSK